VESGQGITQFLHSPQCAFGTASNELEPYNFSTWCTGQSPEHQTLFHSKRKPVANEINTIVKISIAVAIPLVLKNACRRGINKYNATTAIRFSFEICVVVNRLLLESPRCLGNKALVAIGQTFLHTPVKTTSNSGATGIKISQNKTIPNAGKNSRQNKMPAPTSQTRACTNLQIIIERKDNWAPDL
jgi:hypothetical protein